jgi:hypothetical protein
MSYAKHGLKRKRARKAVPVLGAAGLSLSLAGGASAVTAEPADMPTPRNTAFNHEITLGEEEIFDVSLGTFYVFDKENSGTLRSGMQLARGGCGCGHGGGCGGCHGCGGGMRGCGGCGGCHGCRGGFGRGCRGCGFGGCGGCGGCGGLGGCCLSWGGCALC